MERRTVRIYKAHDGQGKYINKTQKFLEKAQMGAETRSESVMENNQLEPIINYINGALDNEIDPKKIYTSLVSKGLPKDVVYPLLTKLLEEREAATEESEEEANNETQDNQIQPVEYQPIGQEEETVEDTDSGMQYFNSYADEDEGSGVMDEEEYQDGGPIYSYDQLNNNNEDSTEDYSPELIEKLTSLKNFVDSTSDNFSDFGKDITEYADNYTPVEWDTLGDGYGSYQKGGSKKNFAKNVLALIKKQEGGDNEEIGRGNKQDTLTNDVSKRKNSFVEKLKEVSSKAAVDSIYEKMMKSNNPELMRLAQELASKRQQNSQMGTFEPIDGAQSGGYIGEFQPDKFNQGGFDIPEAQKGLIQKAGDFLLGEQYLRANNPYSVTTGALYRDPVSGLTPVARTVHKKGIFGRPKKWTDYYSKEGVKPLTPGQEIKQAYEKALKNQKLEEKGDKKSNLKHGMSEKEWDSLPGNAKRAIRRGEIILNKTKGYEDKTEFTIDDLIALQEQKLKKENDAAYKERKDLIEKDNKRKKDFGRIDDLERKKAVWETINDRIKNNINKEEPEKLSSYNLKDFILNNADTFKDAEAIKKYDYNPYEFLPESNQNELLLNNSKEEDFLEKYKIPMLENLIEYQKQFLPSENFDQRETYEFKQYGGDLGRYQIKGAVKSPTNDLSNTSDPTANSGNLVDVLKPQKNPNTFMGVSAPWMNQNLQTVPQTGETPIEMDPNQTKDQKITSLDFGDTKNDDLIAQDVERKRKFDGVNFNNKLNAAADFATNIMNNLQFNKQQNKMYANNFNADSIYGASTNKDRGDYVAYGQQTGMFRPDETGNNTNGRFAYGQEGGYMQDGGYAEDDVVDMTEDELAEFIANGGEVEYLES